MRNERECLEATVVLPTFNRVDLLRLTLAALVNQAPETPRFEVVVADDGSTDDTFAAVREFEHRVEVKYAYYTDNGYHPTRARNVGIKLAEGRVCIFLDCGSLPCSRFVLNHVRKHTASNAAVIGYMYGLNGTNAHDGAIRRAIDSACVDDTISRMKGDPDLADAREKIFVRCADNLGAFKYAWALFWGGNLSVSTGMARQVGGFDENYRSWGVDDVDFGMALKQAGADFVLARSAATVLYPTPKDARLRLQSHEANIDYFHKKYGNVESELLYRIRSPFRLAEREADAIPPVGGR